MLKTLSALIAIVGITTTAFAFTGTESPNATVPLPPDTGIATSTSTPATTSISAPLPPPVPVVPAAQPAAPKTFGYPTRLNIPSISINTKIVPMGLTSDGQLDVPSGSTNNVGWYKGGTIPGDVGSAVLDAHVFAAFGNLKNLKVGSHVYVTNDAGKKLDFVVKSSMLYKLSELTPEMLFNQNDARRLNLITCAGKLTPDHSTYDHRLVVYAVLAN